MAIGCGVASEVIGGLLGQSRTLFVIPSDRAIGWGVASEVIGGLIGSESNAVCDAE
jgi:hypothetical protein